jgi:histone H3/H4
LADILLVVSKLKSFVHEKTEFSTSSEFVEVLSQRVEKLCLEAAARARVDKRKTIKARDLL